MDGIQEKYNLLERHACGIVGQHRGTQRYVPTMLPNEAALTGAVLGRKIDPAVVVDWVWPSPAMPMPRMKRRIWRGPRWRDGSGLIMLKRGLG